MYDMYIVLLFRFTLSVHRTYYLWCILFMQKKKIGEKMKKTVLLYDTCKITEKFDQFYANCTKSVNELFLSGKKLQF